ncbi:MULTISPECIES: hypothetical protein [Pseudomonadaceae]|uniref:hypothetical protein n=1 Tax=Pseudomonadaceae TaxID=135621 RepID=UPI0015E282EF|nr:MULTISPECIES: hypothetical protein [Pseudomonadaceae]MBA1261547.1 hypothetical protein [Stutzerimonas stutzeri]MBF6043443.1 hypothetical protein [Pseudomonas mucoides]
MTEYSPTLGTPKPPPRRQLIVAAFTGFNMYLIGGMVTLVHVLPETIGQYLLGMTLLVWVFQCSGGLVYELYYRKAADRAFCAALVVVYGLGYVLCIQGSNPQLPTPPQGISTNFVISALIIVALGAIASFLTRWTVWGDFRLRLMGL